MNMKTIIISIAIAAIGATIGYSNGTITRSIHVKDCTNPSNHDKGDPCYNTDACANSLVCRYISANVYIAVSPSGYELRQSGPENDIECKRVTSDNKYCTHGTADTFIRPTCGTQISVNGK